MIIDERKVVDKSKSLGKGYKGMIPTSFKRGALPHEKFGNWARAIIGFSLVAALVAGTIALIYSLVTEGGTAVERIVNERDKPAKPAYVEVTIKPKNSDK